MTSTDVLPCTPHEEVITKATLRLKVWNLLENKDLVRFPRPCKGRVPNFVDCLLAADKLVALDVFKNAKVIKVNIDKPQEPVRFAILEAGKTLLVPTSRLSGGLFLKVCPPPEANKQVLRVACRRRGIDKFGKPMSLEDEKIHVDMIVMGSVAVSTEGYRVGKGEGYSDLEFAVMLASGVVTEDTVVVTTVHDEQVFDSLPHNLFQPFDVPVDFIITPTKVIEVTPRLPKPKGILWNILSDRRLQKIPLLKPLRDKDMDSGKDCSLKEVDSEPEDRPRPYYRPIYPRRRLPYQNRQQSQESRTGNGSPTNDRDRPTRVFRSHRKQVDGSGDAEVTINGTGQPRAVKGERRMDGENQQQSRQRAVKGDRRMDRENKENQQQSRQRQERRLQRRFYRNKPPVDFSVKVGNIGSTVRVRDLKAALHEKGVRPRDITWKGPRGFAFLHFAKMKAETEQPTAVDDVIASLRGLTVKCMNETEVQETLLSVEPAKPISRIEDAGVTSV